MDYRVALQMTHNIMILEIIHRVVVCIFEVRMSWEQSSNKPLYSDYTKVYFILSGIILWEKGPNPKQIATWAIIFLNDS